MTVTSSYYAGVAKRTFYFGFYCCLQIRICFTFAVRFLQFSTHRLTKVDASWAERGCDRILQYIFLTIQILPKYKICCLIIIMKTTCLQATFYHTLYSIYRIFELFCFKKYRFFNMFGKAYSVLVAVAVASILPYCSII